MKKKSLLYIIFCLAAIMCGCQTQKRPLCRVVTQVDVYCNHDGLPIHRQYTENKKMEAVLLYLRLLRPGGAPATDPDTVDADIYEIKVTLSDGLERFYRQKDHRYFQEALSGWQSIAPERASRLYALLRHYPSDL